MRDTVGANHVIEMQRCLLFHDKIAEIKKWKSI